MRTSSKQLAKLMEQIGNDDVLVVTRFDHPARSTRDLLNVLGAVTERKEPQIFAAKIAHRASARYVLADAWRCRAR